MLEAKVLLLIFFFLFLFIRTFWPQLKLLIMTADVGSPSNFFSSENESAFKNESEGVMFVGV